MKFELTVLSSSSSSYAADVIRLTCPSEFPLSKIICTTERGDRWLMDSEAIVRKKVLWVIVKPAWVSSATLDLFRSLAIVEEMPGNLKLVGVRWEQQRVDELRA